MAMEFIDGIALSSRIKRGKIDTAFRLEVVLQVLDVLKYAHLLGVVHLDVKPTNIMLAKGSVVKLMDFGIAHCSADYSLPNPGDALGSGLLETRKREPH